MREKPKNSANNIGYIAIVGIIVGVVLFLLGLAQRADKGTSGMLIAGLVILCLSILLIFVARLMKQSAISESSSATLSRFEGDEGDKDEVEIEDVNEGYSSNYSEKDIENAIVKNPDRLESGLKVVEQQKRIPPVGDAVGVIDVFCKDQYGDYVVVELKKGKDSHKAMGQIQLYMSWVNEHIAKAEGKRVRGIIVTREHDEKLQYAIKLCTLPIEIKQFGDKPPITTNYRICDYCGREIPKDATYCRHCRKQLMI